MLRPRLLACLLVLWLESQHCLCEKHGGGLSLCSLVPRDLGSGKTIEANSWGHLKVWWLGGQPSSSLVFQDVTLKHIQGVGIDVYNLFLIASLLLFHRVNQGFIKCHVYARHNLILMISSIEHFCPCSIMEGNENHKNINKTNICICSGGVGKGSVEGGKEATISPEP